VKFLKEERQFSFNQIAKILDRDNRTIWSSYHNAAKKKKARFTVKKARMLVPLDVFSNRNIGMLETLSAYLKEKRGMNFHQIGLCLNRNERTIWASYNSARKKRQKNA
jgi:hypothetical protein